MLRKSGKERLDETDKSILRILQEDGRISNSELARRVSLSPPSIHARVRRLEDEGYIGGYRAVLDREKTGLDLLCFIRLSIQLHQYEMIGRFREAISEMPEVLECHNVTGDFDYLLKVVFYNRKDLEHFVLRKLTPIPGVERLQTSVVLNEVKSTTMLPLE